MRVGLSRNEYVAEYGSSLPVQVADGLPSRATPHGRPPRAPQRTIVPPRAGGHVWWTLLWVLWAGCAFGQPLFPERVRVEWTSSAEPVAAAYFPETSVVGGRGVQLRFNALTGCVSLVSPQTVSLSAYQSFETVGNAVEFTAPTVESDQLRNRSNRVEFGREVPGLLSPETLPVRLVLFPLLWQDLNGNGLLDFSLEGPSELACVAEGVLEERPFWLYEVLIETRSGQAEILALGKQPAPDSNLPERVVLSDDATTRWRRDL